MDLGEGSEGLRKYLLGDGTFPANMALVVQVNPKPVILIAFTDPIRVVDHEFARYPCYVPGVAFIPFVGDNVRERLNDLEIVTNPARPVMLMDVSAEIQDAMQWVTQGATRTKQLISTRAEIAQKIKDGTLKF